jgi:hypothetical protein
LISKKTTQTLKNVVKASCNWQKAQGKLSCDELIDNFTEMMLSSEVRRSFRKYKQNKKKFSRQFQSDCIEFGEILLKNKMAKSKADKKLEKLTIAYDKASREFYQTAAKFYEVEKLE